MVLSTNIDLAIRMLRHDVLGMALATAFWWMVEVSPRNLDS